MINKIRTNEIRTNKIKVWDILIRVFHWSLVLAFVIGYLSGEEESDIHIYAGYTVLGLIIFRFVWGFIGSRYARFSSFVSAPADTLTYLKKLPDKPRRYIGHNPAGGLMVVLMLITLFVVSVSGLKVYAIEEGKGPLAVDVPSLSLMRDVYANGQEHEHKSGDSDSDDSDSDGHEDNWSEEFWEEIHEASANFMVLLIILHIAGVVVMGRLHGENLVKSMITGNKENRDIR